MKYVVMTGLDDLPSVIWDEKEIIEEKVKRAIGIQDGEQHVLFCPFEENRTRNTVADTRSPQDNVTHLLVAKRRIL